MRSFSRAPAATCEYTQDILPPLTGFVLSDPIIPQIVSGSPSAVAHKKLSLYTLASKQYELCPCGLHVQNDSCHSFWNVPLLIFGAQPAEHPFLYQEEVILFAAPEPVAFLQKNMGISFTDTHYFYCFIIF